MATTQENNALVTKVLPLVPVLDVDDEKGEREDDAEGGNHHERAEDGQVHSGILNP